MNDTQHPDPTSGNDGYASSSASNMGSTPPRERKWLIEPGQSKTIEVDDVTSLKATLISGHLDIIGHDEPTTRVEISSVSGKTLRVTVADGRLDIDHPQLRWDNFINVFKSWKGRARAEVSVLVPRETLLTLGTVDGDALVAGIHSKGITLNTVSGDLATNGIDGSIAFTTVSGDVTAHEHNGDVSVHTVSGDATAQGHLRSFNAEGVSGNVFLDLDGTPDRVSNHTVSGDLTVRIDPDTPAHYQVNTVSGVVRAEGSLFKGGAARNFEHSTGSLDDHWLDLNAKSVSGNVSVVRREASAGGTSTAPGAGMGTGGGTDGGKVADTKAFDTVPFGTAGSSR